MGKVIFNYKGSKYTIVSHSVQCHIMTVEKQGGTIARDIIYPGNITVKDFMEKLSKINFGA